jgi:hypothetical protein
MIGTRNAMHPPFPAPLTETEFRPVNATTGGIFSTPPVEAFEPF